MDKSKGSLRHDGTQKNANLYLYQVSNILMSCYIEYDNHLYNVPLLLSALFCSSMYILFTPLITECFKMSLLPFSSVAPLQLNEYRYVY